jgi:hypothetical protein
VLLLTAKSGDAMAAVHPRTKAALEGGAPHVIAQALRCAPPALPDLSLAPAAHAPRCLSAAMGAMAVEESGASGFCSARGAAAVAAHVKARPPLHAPSLPRIISHPTVVSNQIETR